MGVMRFARDNGSRRSRPVGGSNKAQTSAGVICGGGWAAASRESRKTIKDFSPAGRPAERLVYFIPRRLMASAREGKTDATGMSRERDHGDQVVSLPDDSDLFLGWFMEDNQI
jgi:hypothetical protein